MNINYLEEYTYKEILKTSEILKNNSINSYRDLFPELTLNEPYANLNIHPFYSILPFYNTLLFSLYPVSSEDKLIQTHGLTVNQLIELQKNGKIQILLAGDPTIYQNLHFLEPIFELQPPSPITRYKIFWGKTNIWDKVYNGYLLGERLYHNKLATLHKSIGISSDLNHFEISVISGIAFLAAMGQESNFDYLEKVSKVNIAISALYSDMFQDLFCGPSMISLGGLHMINPAYRESISNLLDKDCLKKDAASIFFPEEIGKLLINKYELVKPINLTNSLEIWNDYRSAREALVSLTSYIRKNDTENILNQAEIAEQAFNEVTNIYKKKKNIQTTCQVIGTIGAAASGLSGNLAGVIASMSFGFLGTNLMEKPIEKLTKFGLQSEIIALHDFEQMVTTKRQKR